MPSPALSAPGDKLVVALDCRPTGTGPSLTELHATAERLCAQPDLLDVALTTIRAERATRQAVAARSYWHPNGFAKVVLNTGADYSLRLHVWTERRPWSGDLNPHGHRWEFASWVIAGALREFTFSEVASGEPAGTFHRCEYGRRPGGGRYLQPVGDVTLYRTDEMLRTAGHVYDCARTVVHAVDPVGSDLIATLVVQGPPSVDPTVVYLHPKAPREHREDTLSETDLDEVLGAVVARPRSAFPSTAAGG